MTSTSSPFDPGCYDKVALRGFGFAQVGHNVRIARNCTILGLDRITLGSHARIDGYTTLSAVNGFLHAGSRVHIGSGSFLVADRGVLSPWTVWAGIPAKPGKVRSRKPLELEPLLDGPEGGPRND